MSSNPEANKPKKSFKPKKNPSGSSSVVSPQPQDYVPQQFPIDPNMDPNSPMMPEDLAYPPPWYWPQYTPPFPFYFPPNYPFYPSPFGFQNPQFFVPHGNQPPFMAYEAPFPLPQNIIPQALPPQPEVEPTMNPEMELKVVNSKGYFVEEPDDNDQNSKGKKNDEK